MTKKNPRVTAEKRIILFRILTVISLICTGVLCATFGYILFSKGEDEFYTRQYKSLTNNLFRTLIDGIRARNSAGRSFAATYGGYCSTSSSWPHCWIPYDTFVRITSSLGVSLNMFLIGLLPIIRPGEVAEFENFARQILVNESYPSTTGYASGEFGIYSLNSTTGHVYHDTTGENMWNPYGVLIPFFQYYRPFTRVIMYNALSVASQALPLNTLMSCSQLKLTCNASVTDILNLRLLGKDTPTTVMYVPVRPVKNNSDLVGFVSIMINWPDVLESGVPSVMSNIYAILRSGKTEVTFYFKNGRAEYRGVGDHHDRKFDYQKEQFYFSLTGSDIRPFNYSITLYPAQQFYNTYHTDAPFYVCLISLLIVFVTSMIFLIYDFFAKTESLQQSRILEAKQSYVRFISHVRCSMISL